MQGITGLAIPRHTGLGYLVTKDIKKRVPLNAFQVFNLFRKGFHIIYIKRNTKKLNNFKLSSLKLLSDEHASGRCILEISGDWNLFSTPQPRKRQLPTVSLLPSGPRPVSAVRVRRSVLQQILIPAPSKQDGASQLRSPGWNLFNASSFGFVPRISAISGYR